jgi:restriction system protein
LFKVKTHRAEFLVAIEAGLKGPVPAQVSSEDEATEIAQAEDEPNAERIETYTRDFVIEALHRQLDPYQFEEFIAELLRAMGYRASATQASGDGGVDVIAYRDPLGLEPPIIKVQCKRTLGTIGGPDIQKLAGALAHGGSEVGLFVTLGSFSNDAIHIERTRQDLRLLNGNSLVATIFEHYEQLSPRWKRILPMRRVYVVDKEPETNLS